MAIDNWTLDRSRNYLQSRSIHWVEKKMFGGVCFMVDEKLCFGISDRGLLARVGPEKMDELLQRPFTRQMVNGNRPMVGYIYVDANGYDTEVDFEFWVNLCLAYNRHAQSSKKKK